MKPGERLMTDEEFGRAMREELTQEEKDYFRRRLIPDDLVQSIQTEIGLTQEQAADVVFLVSDWLGAVYPDNIHMGDRYGWAVRYVKYLLTSGTPHRETKEALDKKYPPYTRPTPESD